MNDKINQMIQQNERIWNLYQIGPVQKAEVEQFMESIVDECVDWITDHVGFVPPEATLSLKKYFGLVDYQQADAVDFADLVVEFSNGDQRKAIGAAIASPNVNAFIDAHKEGWIGDEGKFARVIARALSTI